MQASSDRLPWLTDEPHGGSAKVAPKKAGGTMWPWYLLLLLLVGVVLAGAWWLSTGKNAAPPTLPAETSLPIPVTREAATAPDALVEAPLEPVTEPSGEPTQSEAGTRAVAVPRTVNEPRRRQVQVVEQEVDSAGRGIFPADEPAAAPPATGPSPIVLYHPQPNRGRVVQLGAYPTRAQAEASWRRITRRYPYLSSKPKMVNTVDVRAMGGGRPTRMFRLQLGTSSQAQSVVICQQLERAGHSCVVVY